MPCRALRFLSGWLGGTTVLVLAGSIVLMLGLEVAPNLHERLHPTAAPLHECAVTLIASGCCHHTVAAPLVVAPATTRTIFEDSGSPCDLGCSAVSWRMYF